MALRKLLRDRQLPSKALFFFPDENMTGIAPTKIITQKEKAVVGQMVTVKWQGENVEAKIIALSGKYLSLLQLQFILRSVQKSNHQSTKQFQLTSSTFIYNRSRCIAHTCTFVVIHVL